MPASAAVLSPPAHTSRQSLPDTIRILAREHLSPIITDIDHGKIFPSDAMRAFGAVGAWASHVPNGQHADLRDAIGSIAAIGETCGSTSFMAWCQNTCVWYAANSDNTALHARLLDSLASGRTLGGTGLSNPMKTFFGIETMKLKGRRVAGGYSVRGALPWVSNLGDDHFFGTIFELEDASEGAPSRVMFMADCAAPGLTLKPCEPFLAMDGTGTYGVQFRDVFVPDDLVLAHDAMPFVRNIRAGFVMLQNGMGTGLIRDCIALMHEMRGPLGHVNRYLPEQPEDYEARLTAIEDAIEAIAQTPFDKSDAFWRRVLETRLAVGETTLAAANAVMLHCGARGYVSTHRAQRRLREAMFVAIVTPATKQLRKMLAEMAP